MGITFHTIQTRVTKAEHANRTRAEQLNSRVLDLDAAAERGYTLAHTATIDTEESLIFIDTLTRTTTHP